ncbi:hypothetical protein QL285_063435 [Trifolium repens]|nr:hypothetical protein QL285_063435 [Trifolium repens]
METTRCGPHFGLRNEINRWKRRAAYTAACASNSSAAFPLNREHKLGITSEFWWLEFVAVAGLMNKIKAPLQVDRLTGARTRMELMIGAELGSSH